MSVARILVAALLLVAVGACVSSPTVRPSEPHGIVSLELPSDGSHIRIVRITEIDGINYGSGENNSVWLAPGKHTLRVVARSQSERAIPNRYRGPGSDASRLLEIDIEEGKRYLIGAIVAGDDDSDWVPVVVEISDI